MNSKNAFWQAFVFAVIVFAVGMIFGFFLEVKQNENIFSRLVDSEINILDNQLRTRIVEDFEVGCDFAKESLFKFADNVYFEAVELEEFDTDGRLSDLTTLHKRYDLLRTLLWVEAKELNKECAESFDILVYLYEYKSEDAGVKAKQDFYSKLLFDIKSEMSEDVLLIPIAVDTGLSSIELITKTKGIDKFPVILINDGTEIYEVLTLDEFRELFNSV
ncbi:MAG: hypothetical protein Q8P57_00530 [Candidatus Pacearchaeota archaeon]|nr:hypothetical protein [Candidatus Pacearchaeota archaeon]